MKSRKSFLTLGIIILVLFLGVGYAVVSSVYLNIGGTANVANSELKVEITNVEAETNMTDKTLDFTNVLSNNNLTSNFTLKNMSLNELVTITYTVTNNEKDVDAIISAIDGVDLTNSNPDCFDVNYQITDNETDLENNDKTMEVVVTVELIKTPLNDDDSSTEVGLTLAAIPKGSNDSQIIGPDTTGDVLDNVWPIEWNTLEVMNNTNLFDGSLVRISKVPITYEELKLLRVEATAADRNMIFTFLDGEDNGSACGAYYESDDFPINFTIISVFEAGDYNYDGMIVTITEPGIYVSNAPSEDYNYDAKLVKLTTPLRFEEEYHVTTFLFQDVRKVLDSWIMFHEDGTLTQYELEFPYSGYTYDETNIYNSELFSDNYNFDSIIISPDGKVIKFFTQNNEVALVFTVKSEFERLSDITYNFGLKYACITDNVNGGNDVGNYFVGYSDGSVKSGVPGGGFSYLDSGTFEYYVGEIKSKNLPDGERFIVSEDGRTVTHERNGEVLHVFKGIFEYDLHGWSVEDIENNTYVMIDKSYINDSTGGGKKFIKVSSNILPYGIMLNTVFKVGTPSSDRYYYDTTISKDKDSYILKYTYKGDSSSYYVIVVPTTGEYFGTTFTETGIYVIENDNTEYKQFDFDY